jgi:type IV pilus assembly protein PilV
MTRRAHRQRGFALIEAMVAVVVLAVGLLGAIGLQARSLAALQDTAMRAEATMAAEKLIGLMSTDQANLGGYGYGGTGSVPASLAPWALETRTRIPNATFAVVVTPLISGSQVAVTIGWRRKAGTAANQYRVSAYVVPAS